MNKTKLNENHDNNETKKETEEIIDFDDILPYTGEFGMYQIFLVISTMPFYFFGVFVYTCQLFMTETPDHWCWIPELQNLTVENRKRLAIPETTKSGYDKCHSYEANWSEILTNGIVPNSTWNIKTCQKGWEYNLTEIPYPTISSELNWVCDQDTNQASAQIIFFAGTLLGCVVFGVVADKYGRIPAIMASNLIGCVAGVASIFATNFVQFAVCRFFTGMAYDSCMMIAYLLTLEYIAPRYRTLLSNLSFGLFLTLAETSLPWIALACGHWKTFALVTSLPLALSVIVPFVLPESPRWLLSKGRIDDAEKKLFTISRINKKEIPLDVMMQFKFSHEIKSKANIDDVTIDILKRPLLRKVLILISFECFCCMLIFDILIRSLGGLDFNFFVSFSVISSTDFPSLLTVALVMNYVGRRWLVALSMFLCCIASIGSYFATGVTSVVCIFFARLSVNTSLTACFQWAAEMLPTPVRGTYLSVIHTITYLATLVSPYVVYLDNKFVGLHFIILALVAIVGGVNALILPETTNKCMPETIISAENLIKSQTFWELPCRNVIKETKHGVPM